jgi:CBS domain-containing protein
VIGSVGDVMSTAVTRVGTQAQLDSVLGLLQERAVTAVPVVDESDHLVGILSAMDLVDPGLSNLVAGRRLRRMARRNGGHAKVADRMSRPVVSVAPETSLRTAARLLQVHDIHHLPVVAGGKLVGMVTRRDLLAAFLRADEQIRRQVAHAAQITFNVLPDQLTVRVHNGVVRLDGRVGLRSLARELAGQAAGTDGVIAVESRLEWDLDDLRTDSTKA